ncbi:RNA-directed DNA polymerase, eukaryota, reverse transcriptase zinc-binding domain protein [Tanacetum coccineum]
MVRAVVDSEIKDAMFSIDDDQATGPDGFTLKIFKSAWSVVGSDVCVGLKNFSLLVIDYRPIAGCNVVYKCISKVITNRLKEGLSELIDPNESAYAFKIDIQKAYDTVNWNFRRTTLQHFGLHNSMIQWIFVCLSTASFSIFMEVFNLMVKRQIRLDDRFMYHWACSKIELTHLCFADNLLLLFHEDHNSDCIFRRALDEFSMISGLYPSMAKSRAFYGNVREDVKEQIHLAMPFSEDELPIRYLGIPLSCSKLRNPDCRVVVENVKK